MAATLLPSHDQDIDIANDLWGTSGMKPESLEDINVVFGRRVAANFGEIWRHLMFDTKAIFSAAAGLAHELTSDMATIGVMVSDGRTIRRSFYFDLTGSRGMLSARALLYLQGNGTTVFGLESNSGDIVGGTIANLSGYSEEWVGIGTMIHGLDYNTDGGNATFYLDHTISSGACLGGVKDLTVFNWGTT